MSDHRTLGCSHPAEVEGVMACCDLCAPRDGAFHELLTPEGKSTGEYKLWKPQEDGE